MSHQIYHVLCIVFIILINFDLCAGGVATPSPASVAASKKNSSRRNAWGNLSYADLITQAITSSQDSRLTLSQIYEWMVQNVPYFKDKGDSNSSAGWKVKLFLPIFFVFFLYRDFIRFFFV